MINNGEQASMKWQENAVFYECLSVGGSSEHLHQLYAEIVCMDSKDRMKCQFPAVLLLSDRLKMKFYLRVGYANDL